MNDSKKQEICDMWDALYEDDRSTEYLLQLVVDQFDQEISVADVVDALAWRKNGGQ